MKRFTRCVCMLLICAMFLAMPAFAAESRSSSFFGSSGVYLYKTTSKSFEAWFDVDAVGTMDELGASVIKIQRSSDGENWTTMKTFTKESNPDLICKNTAGHGGYVSYIGTSGYYYRAYYVLYAKNSSGTGELYRYSAAMLL